MHTDPGKSWNLKQDDHLSGKPGNVRELYRCQGNVRNFTKSHGNVRKLNCWKKSCHGKLCDFYNYPVTGRGTGYCFRAISFFVSLFVSLSATLRENSWTDLHEIFREGVE